MCFRFWLWFNRVLALVFSLSRSRVHHMLRSFGKKNVEDVIWKVTLRFFNYLSIIQNHHACVLTILELNWNQRFFGNIILNTCHNMLTSSTQPQNRSFSRRGKNEDVYKMSKNEKCTCKECKNNVFHCQICKFEKIIDKLSRSWS